MLNSQTAPFVREVQEYSALTPDHGVDRFATSSRRPAGVTRSQLSPILSKISGGRGTKFRAAASKTRRSTEMRGRSIRRTLKEFGSPRSRVDVAVPAWTRSADRPDHEERARPDIASSPSVVVGRPPRGSVEDDRKRFGDFRSNHRSRKCKSPARASESRVPGPKSVNRPPWNLEPGTWNP